MIICSKDVVKIQTFKHFNLILFYEFSSFYNLVDCSSYSTVQCFQSALLWFVCSNRQWTCVRYRGYVIAKVQVSTVRRMVVQPSASIVTR